MATTYHLVLVHPLIFKCVPQWNAIIDELANVQLDVFEEERSQGHVNIIVELT